MNVQTQDFPISGAVSPSGDKHQTLGTAGGEEAQQRRCPRRSESLVSMQEPCDGSAAGSLASPAWNSTHE